MGQKANVNSLHIIKNKNWNSFWYANYQNYSFVFQEDFYIYLYLRSHSKLKYSVLKRQHIYKIEISKTLIYRMYKSIILNLHFLYLVSRQTIIHHNVKNFVKLLLHNLKKIFDLKNNYFLISYTVGKNNALFVALKIATLIEKRIKFQSKIVEQIIKKIDCKGICVAAKGRLNFIDRAKQDKISFGSIPLQTLNVKIDYGLIVANTKKGNQSIKVWIFS